MGEPVISISLDPLRSTWLASKKFAADVDMKQAVTHTDIDTNFFYVEV
jgi:hypothetical protein